MAISWWRKFLLLLWKNWTLQWAHKAQMFIELFIPACFASLMVIVRTLIEVETKPEFHFPPVSIDNLDLYNASISSKNSGVQPQNLLYYTPENDILAKLVFEAAVSLGLKSVGFDDPEAQEIGFKATNAFAAIEFDPSWSSITELPKKLKYTLRFPAELRTGTPDTFMKSWTTMRLFRLLDLTGPRNPAESDGGNVGYLREGFLPIQNALSTAFIRMKSGAEELPDIVMQRYPYPSYVEDLLLQGLGAIVPLIILLSFIYPCTCVVRNVTTEKETQLKEVMKIMGLSNWLHWTAWFVKSFMLLTVSAIVIVLLMVIRWKYNVAILTYGSFSAVLFFLIIYIIASICFCFMISPMFTKASTAAAVTGLVWFIAYLPFSLALQTYTTMPLATKVGWCFLSNTAMGFGMKLILDFESSGQGFHWENMFSPVNIDDDLSVGIVIVVMLISAVIYLLIGLYVEQVFPGEFGIGRRWYFPVQRSFWCKQNQQSEEAENRSSSSIGLRDKNTFESEPDDKPIGVQLINLKKKFGKKMAVKGISLNMFQDEITVLLGHNGAGKTTTISMLTGMFPPTAGTAIINGSDILTNIEGARMSLGLCPQHNVLFDDMSVGNHIRFFSRLKGLKGEAVEKEVTKYLGLIQLENKSKAYSSTLSGGMKRKLSLCCALCGDTKVVLCDEPSSGMDPAARRQLWELLQKEKTGRTILLTTHFMDEADVLGDRIAIMCDGELKCYGTSFFLKKHYGSGYSLICVKEDKCKPEDITALLALYIPGIKPKSDIGAELSYELPDRYSDRFEKMFGALEDRSKELHLSGYGIGITTLEEVFMKVGAETNAEQNRKEGGQTEKDGSSSYLDYDNELSQRGFSMHHRSLQGMQLTMNQWRAMMLKKILYTWRNKLMFFIQNLMPAFFIVLTILISRSQSTFRELPAIEISLRQYPKTTTVMEIFANVSKDSDIYDIAQHYEKVGNSFGSAHSFVNIGNEPFENYILNIGKEKQTSVNTHYLVAATMGDERITAWLNNQPLHTAPLTVNMVHNAMAKKYIGEDASISVTNWPYPYATETLLSQLNMGNNIGTQMASNLCFCMCFICAMYIIFLVKERNSRSKLLQFVSGVRVLTFWLTQYIWDFITFTFTCAFMILVIFCFQESGYTKFDELGRYFLILILFVLAVLPFTYLVSFLFKDASTGFARYSIFNIFVGNALFILATILSIELFNVKEIADLLTSIFHIFPTFTLATGLNNAYAYVATKIACDKVSSLPPILICELVPSCCNLEAPFSWEPPGIMKVIVYFIGIAVISFALLIAVEYGLFNELRYTMRKRAVQAPPPPEAGYFEEDVEKERQRIHNMTKNEIDSKNLVMDRVTKLYGPFLAVNQVSLCVEEMECFGLLGVNGAGKTTTFKMLTGDEKISSGAAYIQGLSIEKHRNRMYKKIGYCPQFDALLDDLTGRETLRIFCMLRGVQEEFIKPISEELSNAFGFNKHIDKRTKVYSGGNKRKLSAAIAVLGAPSVIYLDEPTTGMDPAARRQLWNVVCRVRDSGKSIVLTSHSMEECEALCTRLAVMVNGEFKCLGSTQHLKNKFSKGIILKIKVRSGRESVYSRATTVGLRKQDLDESVPTTPLPYESTSNLSLHQSVDSLKQPISNGSLTEEQASRNPEVLPGLPAAAAMQSSVNKRSSDDIIVPSARNVQDNVELVKEFVNIKFPQAILQEEYKDMMTYYIPLDAIKWSKIFGLMERNRYELYIEDYSISQTTLEEIFLDFAKFQREDPRTAKQADSKDNNKKKRRKK